MIWSTLALLPLLCGTWVIGLLVLAANEVEDENASKILAWIFTVINSLQVINECISVCTLCLCVRSLLYVIVLLDMFDH